MNLYCAIVSRLRAVPGWVLPLAARLAMAGVFFKSGLTKVTFDGGIHFSSSVQYLFEQEYALPLLPWNMAAFMAASAELMLPPLLVLGLATRISAAALLAMTIVIQVFVYPAAWDTHLTWAVALGLLLVHGPGEVSLDRAFCRRAFSGACA